MTSVQARSAGMGTAAVVMGRSWVGEWMSAPWVIGRGVSPYPAAFLTRSGSED